MTRFTNAVAGAVASLAVGVSEGPARVNDADLFSSSMPPALTEQDPFFSGIGTGTDATPATTVAPREVKQLPPISTSIVASLVRAHPNLYDSQIQEVRNIINDIARKETVTTNDLEDYSKRLKEAGLRVEYTISGAKDSNYLSKSILHAVRDGSFVTLDRKSGRNQIVDLASRDLIRTLVSNFNENGVIVSGDSVSPVIDLKPPAPDTPVEVEKESYWNGYRTAESGLQTMRDENRKFLEDQQIRQDRTQEKVDKWTETIQTMAAVNAAALRGGILDIDTATASLATDGIPDVNPSSRREREPRVAEPAPPASEPIATSTTDTTVTSPVEATSVTETIAEAVTDRTSPAAPTPVEETSAVDELLGDLSRETAELEQETIRRQEQEALAAKEAADRLALEEESRRVAREAEIARAKQLQETEAALQAAREAEIARLAEVAKETTTAEARTEVLNSPPVEAITKIDGFTYIKQNGEFFRVDNKGEEIRVRDFRLKSYLNTIDKEDSDFLNVSDGGKASYFVHKNNIYSLSQDGTRLLLEVNPPANVSKFAYGNVELGATQLETKTITGRQNDHKFKVDYENKKVYYESGREVTDSILVKFFLEPEKFQFHEEKVYGQDWNYLMDMDTQLVYVYGAQKIFAFQNQGVPVDSLIQQKSRYGGKGTMTLGSTTHQYEIRYMQDENGNMISHNGLDVRGNRTTSTYQIYKIGYYGEIQINNPIFIDLLASEQVPKYIDSDLAARNGIPQGYYFELKDDQGKVKYYVVNENGEGVIEVEQNKFLKVRAILQSIGNVANDLNRTSFEIRRTLEELKRWGR